VPFLAPTRKGVETQEAQTVSVAHVLREYAVLADGHRGAVFATLTGRDGSLRVPSTGRFAWGRHYEEGLLICDHDGSLEIGIVECRKTLAYRGERNHSVVYVAQSPYATQPKRVRRGDRVDKRPPRYRPPYGNQHIARVAR
jgi:hypothetical protein